MKAPASRVRDSYHVGNLAPRLLDAARKRLERTGTANLSVRAIAKDVGVSATASYHHFAARGELLGHLAAQGFGELHNALAGIGEPSDGRKLLERACLAYFSFARENPALYQLMFGPELAGEDVIAELRNARAAAFGELKRIIARVLGPGAEPADVQRAAVGSWSYTHGLASLWLHGVLQVRGTLSSETLVNRTLHGLARLIQAPPGDETSASAVARRAAARSRAGRR